MKRSALLFFVLLCSGVAAATPIPDVPIFAIKDQGTEFPVRFEKYGTFLNLGMSSYSYVIKDSTGLARAIGGGLLPGAAPITSDPEFLRWRLDNPSDALDCWAHAFSTDARADVYAWLLTRNTGPGTRLFFAAQALYRSGHHRLALKAAHAVVVLYPRETAWSADRTSYWSVADAALSLIENITTHKPEIGVRLDGATYFVANRNDNNPKNDVITVNPGRMVRFTAPKPVLLDGRKVVARRGTGRVRLEQYDNGHWRMFVEDKPIVVRGVTYSPVPVGRHVSDYGTQWLTEDLDGNGWPDMPFDAWLDANKNGVQDANEPARGDFQIIRDMGANAIRFFHEVPVTGYKPNKEEKETLRYLYERYGMYAIMGDFLGAYTVGSGASWETGTDYTNPVHRENMKKNLRAFVLDHKDEPYVLVWLLGNENFIPSDYAGVNATRTNAADKPEAFLSFVNEMAEMIHEIDPNHPVAFGNLDTVNLHLFAKYAPAVDIYGANSYRGGLGFGNLWRRLREQFDRPVIVTEFGCDAFDSRTNEENQRAQAEYLYHNWENIEIHRGGGRFEGNALGGLVFEYIDEWWKSLGAPYDAQEKLKDASMAFPDGWSSEEWLGVLSRGSAKDGRLERRPREAYELLRDELWRPYRMGEVDAR